MNNARERVLDELLVVRCQQGDRESFDLLARRWQRSLWLYARRLMGGEQEAWDVMQEAWMAMLRDIRKLRDPAWFPAWSHRIVRRKCADYSRSAGRQRRLASALANDRRGDLDSRPADHAMTEAIRQLPDDRREVLLLRYGGELSIVEIAFVLGIPAGTVKSRLHNARELLERILKGDVT